MRYLSEEWLQAANAAVQAEASSAPTKPLVVDQHVEGAISYRVKIERDKCSIGALDSNGHSAEADATFRQSSETAKAIATGATDAHQAFLLGHIIFVGDVEALIAGRDALNWLEATLAPLLSQTTFD